MTHCSQVRKCTKCTIIPVQVVTRYMVTKKQRGIRWFCYSYLALVSWYTANIGWYLRYSSSNITNILFWSMHLAPYYCATIFTWRKSFLSQTKQVCLSSAKVTHKSHTRTAILVSVACHRDLLWGCQLSMIVRVRNKSVTNSRSLDWISLYLAPDTVISTVVGFHPHFFL